eukprot:COSAG01_NODE_503_length_16167_cov_10.407230_13_plen_112_part_00
MAVNNVRGAGQSPKRREAQRVAHSARPSRSIDASAVQISRGGGVVVVVVVVVVVCCCCCCCATVDGSSELVLEARASSTFVFASSATVWIWRPERNGRPTIYTIQRWLEQL